MSSDPTGLPPAPTKEDLDRLFGGKESREDLPPAPPATDSKSDSPARSDRDNADKDSGSVPEPASIDQNAPRRPGNKLIEDLWLGGVRDDDDGDMMLVQSKSSDKAPAQPTPPASFDDLAKGDDVPSVPEKQETKTASKKEKVPPAPVEQERPEKPKTTETSQKQDTPAPVQDAKSAETKPADAKPDKPKKVGDIEEGIDPDATWPGEPNRFNETHIDPLLLWSVQQGSSDISLQTDKPVFNDIAGRLRPGTKRPLDGADLAVFVNKIYGADALARLASGTDLDLSYEIRPDRDTRIRFRVNITAILSRGRDAIQITMRSLPTEPPTLEMLDVEPELIEHWAPRDGIVMVTGPTGSGKSTLLAAANRMLIERPGGCGKMLTYEAPIEFTYDTIASDESLIAQTEIPKHLKSFEAGVRNALRRKPNIILVGEARDRETIAAAIEACQTGHAVYTSTHTTGVASTIRRLVATFEPKEREERAYSLMETMRLICTQILLPKVGGGRVGLREWMAFDEATRERFLDMPPDKWPVELMRAVPKQGRSMLQSAKIAFEQGKIEERHLKVIAAGAKDEDL